MIGKLDPDRLARVLERTGASNPALLTGAAYGEDAAAIDLGEETLVVSADPISLAADRAGTLGVHVACNDVAASGADPEFLTNVIFLPDDDDAETLETLTAQLDTAAAGIDVAIVGGHSEYVPALSRPLLSLTAFGRTDRYIPTGGARPGDAVLLTKGAAIEGTGILATDFVADLRAASVAEDTIDRAAAFFEEISVLEDSRALRSVATAMHDPTEAGLVAAGVEMAAASGVDLVVERAAVPIRPETATICGAMDVDPLRIFGSGALLATVPPEATDAALDALAASGIEAAVIGEATEPASAVDPKAGVDSGTRDDSGTGSDTAGLVLDGERLTDAGTDQLYPLWA
jgi:hydrogenase expression/formation protein HypE